MRFVYVLSVAALAAACSPGDSVDTSDSDTDPSTSDVCVAEAALRADQVALGLTVPAVCGDLIDLGDTTLAAAGVIEAGTDFGAILSADALQHRSEFEGTRRLYGFMGVTLSVPSDADTELAVLTAQAWKRWSETASFAIVADMGAYPTEDTLPCCGWRNAFDHVVVSLDPTPIDIGASVSVIGSPTTSGSEQRYSNTALISIDRETVLGTNALQGSKAIYGAEDPRENELRYFADGAVFTLAHESTHLYVDQRNSVGEVANRIYNGRTFINSAYAVEVTCDANLLPHVETTVRDGTLVIDERPEVASYEPSGRCEVAITVPALVEVRVNGSGDVDASGDLTGFESATDNGSGELVLSGIDGSAVALTSNGSGEIVAAGSTDALIAVNNGSGGIDARDLVAADVEVTNSASGDVVVTATDSADVTLNGSGDVVVYGDPPVQHTTDNGSGSVSFE